MLRGPFLAYSPEQLEQLYAEQQDWLDRGQDLSCSLVTRNWRSAKGNEYGRHGLARRLADLDHSARRIFEVLPPDVQQPTRFALREATVFLHSFVINCFGAIDNAAHIWVSEAGITAANGRELSKSRIGFSTHDKHDRVLASLPPLLRDQILAMTDWQDYLANYRHALAHRIPPYIPPRRWTDRDADRHAALEVDIGQALRARDFDTCDVLRAEQDRLGQFWPVMMHSYGERAQPMLMHPQIVCDLATVVELGTGLIAGLDGL